MRLVIVYFGPFHVNSAIQAFHFAQRPDRRRLDGHPRRRSGDPARIREVGEPNFECVTHHDLADVLERCRRADEPTIVLAWTPREIVRARDRGLLSRGSASRTSIHLEDNEWYLLRRGGRMADRAGAAPLARRAGPDHARRP